MAKKDLAQKGWQEAKNLVEAESAEANAQEKAQCEQVGGGTWGNVGSSGSSEASAAGSEEACKKIHH